MPPLARPGDVLEVRGVADAPPRRGVILAVVGEGPHLHYHVRWDERRESLFFPGDGRGIRIHHHAAVGAPDGA